MRTDQLAALIGALMDGARTDRKTVFFRTLLFGVTGATAAAVVMEVAPRIVGGPSISNYWILMCGSGFFGLAFGNLVSEYLGLYRINLIGRLWRRWSSKRGAS